MKKTFVTFYYHFKRLSASYCTLEVQKFFLKKDIFQIYLKCLNIHLRYAGQEVELQHIQDLNIKEYMYDMTPINIWILWIIAPSTRVYTW